MSYRMPTVQMSKWQWALLVGTPLALGAGYYYYKKSGNDQSKSDKFKGTASISLDDDKPIAQKSAKEVAPLKLATDYKTEGNNCYRNGKFDEAISFYDKAIETCPLENATDMAIFYQNRAAAYEMLSKWSTVKEDCNKSLEFNPRYAKAYFRRAKAHEATNDIIECLNDITACCILETFQNQNSVLYADRVLKRTGREDAERNLPLREPTLPSSNFIHTYMRSFVHDPLQNRTLPEEFKNATSGYGRAKEALDASKYDEIIAACTEEIESSESESQFKNEALLLRGTFHLLSGNFPQSLLDLTAVIDNTEADNMLRSHAHIKRASLHIQMEKKDEGLADFDAAEKLRPDNADIYHQRAQIFILLGELDEALNQFEKVLKWAPDHAMAYVQKCYADYRNALMNQDQVRLMMTLNDFRNAIEKFPNCVECYSLLAQVLSDQQQFDQSDQYFQKAIRLAPQNASLYVHRGIMLLQWKGDVEKAVQLMESALKVDDKCELAFETLATLEVQRVNLERGIELFEKAIGLAKSQMEMCHLYSLRNAAVAQKYVTEKLGIDVKALQALTESNVMAQTADVAAI